RIFCPKIELALAAVVPCLRDVNLAVAVEVPQCERLPNNAVPMPASDHTPLVKESITRTYRRAQRYEGVEGQRRATASVLVDIGNVCLTIAVEVSLHERPVGLPGRSTPPSVSLCHPSLPDKPARCRRADLPRCEVCLYRYLVIVIKYVCNVS